MNKTFYVVLGLNFRLLDKSVSKEEIIIVVLMQISEKILKLFFNLPNFNQQKVIQLKLVIFGLLVVSSERQIFNGSFTKNFGVGWACLEARCQQNYPISHLLSWIWENTMEILWVKIREIIHQLSSYAKTTWLGEIIFIVN